MGLQLVVAWVQMQTLDALRIRDDLAASDLQGKEVQQQHEPVRREARNERLQPQA